MFGDKTYRQARPWSEVAVVDGGNEGVLDRAEGCSVKVLGEFTIGNVMVENAFWLVQMGALWWLLSGGEGPQWDVPQDIGAVPQAGNYDPVLFQYFYIKFGEDGGADVIAELPHRYEWVGCDAVEDMGGLCFGRKFAQKFQGFAKGWFDDVPVVHLKWWAGRGVCDVGAVWRGTGMEVVVSGRSIG